MKVLSVVGMPWDPTPNGDADDGARLPNPDAVEAHVVPKYPEVPESIKSGVFGMQVCDAWQGTPVPQYFVQRQN